MAQLVFIKGFNKGGSVELLGERIVLGRNADCQVVLNIPAVSREHAVIRKINGKYYIEDLKSRNGTFINDQEVSARTQLKDNDKIKICDCVLAFLDDQTLPLNPGDLPAVQTEEEGSSTIEATLTQSSKQVLNVQPTDKLAMLVELGQDLSQVLEPEQLLPKIVESLFNVFRQADRAFIIMAEENRLIPKAIKSRRLSDETTLAFSRKIVYQCLETGQSILSEDATADKRFDLSQSIADCRIRSVMCAPLTGRSAEGRAFGVIQLDTQDRLKKFTQDDLKLLLSVAGVASVAMENASMHQSLVRRAGLERDLKIAHQVQMSILPKRFPKHHGYEFHAHYESAQEVGGDYYDFIPLGDHFVGVLIGDVAGKGIPAALFMAKVASDARFCMLTERNLHGAVTKLNTLMQEAGALDRFVTLGASVVDVKAHRVACANAGHHAPLIYRKAKNDFEVGISKEKSGPPLGVVDDYEFESVIFNLDIGDCVVFFTDGVTEAVNKDDQEFKMSGVMQALKAGPMTPKAMVERLVAAVKHHSQGCKQHDDLTIVALGRLS
jgi:serine phosphatase RsbU (regulator of sigma subunit)/pSer/pThr/pTyr-binding forkhead associated (FHA) protein